MDSQKQQLRELELGNHVLPNGLTIAQEARLKKLSEELGEAQQAVGKILNYGFIANFKGVNYNNRDDLHKELGDIRAVVRSLTRKGDLLEEAIAQRMVVKFPTLAEMIPFEHTDDHLLNPCERP